jgi:hypothetical protein
VFLDGGLTSASLTLALRNRNLDAFRRIAEIHGIPMDLGFDDLVVAAVARGSMEIIQAVWSVSDKPLAEDLLFHCIDVVGEGEWEAVIRGLLDVGFRQNAPTPSVLRSIANSFIAAGKSEYLSVLVDVYPCYSADVEIMDDKIASTHEPKWLEAAKCRATPDLLGYALQETKYPLVLWLADALSKQKVIVLSEELQVAIASHGDPLLEPIRRILERASKNDLLSLMRKIQDDDAELLDFV